MRFLFCMLLFFVANNVVFAEDMLGLYRASIVVADQSVAERKKALSLGLETVFQKVTGRKSVLLNEELQASLLNSASFVEQFQYKKQLLEPAELENPEPAQLENVEQSYQLSVLFNKASVDGALKRYGVPVWGRNRPVVVLWLALKTAQGERSLIGLEQAELAEQIKQAGVAVGLPFVLPLMDLQDQQALAFRDVWGGFSERILKASERFGAEQLLFAKVLETPSGFWQIDWSLANNKTQHDGQPIKQLSFSKGLEEMAQEVANKLADIYAPEGQRLESHISIIVDGITELADITQVFEYLQSLDTVTGVSWQQAKLGQVKLSLRYEGGLEVLKETIKLNSILKEVEANDLVLNEPVLMDELVTVKPLTLHYRVEP